jgi:hypothetical protein
MKYRQRNITVLKFIFGRGDPDFTNGPQNKQMNWD